MVDDKMSDVVN